MERSSDKSEVRKAGALEQCDINNRITHEHDTDIGLEFDTAIWNASPIKSKESAFEPN